MIFERILGRNDLLRSSFLATGAAATRAVGRASLEVSSSRRIAIGTAFLITPQLVMTNHHVFSTAQDARMAVVEFDVLQARDGSVGTPVVHRLDPGRFFLADATLDYAIIFISPLSTDGGSDLVSRGWLSLALADGRIADKEPVNIIQHPGGGPQQVIVRDNDVVEFRGAFLQYQTDTERGSSGSPVFNDQWELVALHHSGVPKVDAEGHILLTDGSRWSGGDADREQIAYVSNEGVLVERIAKDVENTLKDDPGRLEMVRKSYQPFAPERLQPSVVAPVAAVGAGGGRLSITVPLTITVSLGEPGAAEASVVGPASAMPPATPTANPAELAQGSALVAAAESRPYYVAAEDEQDRATYYQDLPDPGSSGFGAALRTLITNTHTTKPSYKAARLQHLYPWVDLRPSGKLASIYSGQLVDPLDVIKSDLVVESLRAERLQRIAAQTGGSEQALEDALDALEASLPFNCEHIVPQSWFAKKSPMVGDLHHLATCESDCNSFRGNIPYFQFPPEDEAVRTNCGRRETAGAEGGRFEPQAGKGTVARATFYFLLRYGGLIGQAGELKADRLPALLRWHRDFPVDEYELHRNAAIAEIQGNRNPFIDHPEWATEALLAGGFGG